MKPTLIEQPTAGYVSHILRNFESGIPLSADQLNFLSNNEKFLSSYGLDPVLKYYLKSYQKKPASLSFIVPPQNITHLTTQQIKRSVQNLLKTRIGHVDLQMTLAQYAQLRSVGMNELIFWHGNHFLTGAPFFPGGIPYVIYFQWGNLFGVVKFQVLPEEKVLKGNLLVYFEDMEDRSLYQCVREYEHKYKDELNLEKQLRNQQQLSEKDREEESLIQTPKLSLKPFYVIDTEKE